MRTNHIAEMHLWVRGKERFSRARVVGYYFEGRFDETDMERLLRRACCSGIITEYDTGRGSVVWFNGRPGRRMRDLRRRVMLLLEVGP